MEMNYLSPLQNNDLPGIERRSDISAQAFLRDYVVPHRPVILPDFAKTWPASGKWTPEFFSTRYGHISTEVKGVLYSVAEQMELIKTSTEEHPAPYSYSLNIDLVFPELDKDVVPRLLGRKDRLANPLIPRAIFKGTIKQEVFFGGKGSSFPLLHVDLQCLHTQITQLYGDKEFFLYAPDQMPFMYPRPDKPLVSQVDNIFNPDLEHFPLFAKAQAHRAMLHEGETIFFPTGWWHVTHIPGPSISYGRALLERTNWSGFLKETYDAWKRESKVVGTSAHAVAKLFGVLALMAE